MSKYITINLDDGTIRWYETVEQATNDSIQINHADENHPAFHLYELGDEVEYLGRLYREFGDDKLFWNKERERWI